MSLDRTGGWCSATKPQVPLLGVRMPVFGGHSPHTANVLSLAAVVLKEGALEEATRGLCEDQECYSGGGSKKWPSC